MTEVYEVSFKFFMDSSFYLGLLQTSVIEAQKTIHETYQADKQGLVRSISLQMLFKYVNQFLNYNYKENQKENSGSIAFDSRGG